MSECDACVAESCPDGAQIGPCPGFSSAHKEVSRLRRRLELAEGVIAKLPKCDQEPCGRLATHISTDEAMFSCDTHWETGRDVALPYRAALLAWKGAERG